MPKKLEAKLKKEYGANSDIPYKIMNKMGMMKGKAKSKMMGKKGKAMKAKMGNAAEKMLGGKMSK